MKEIWEFYVSQAKEYSLGDMDLRNPWTVFCYATKLGRGAREGGLM